MTVREHYDSTRLAGQRKSPNVACLGDQVSCLAMYHEPRVSSYRVLSGRVVALWSHALGVRSDTGDLVTLSYPGDSTPVRRRT